MQNGDAVDIEEMVRHQTPGMSLEQPFYVSREIFERDLERIVSRQWLFVDHVSSIPEEGDYITYELAGESIILIRDRAGEVRAFFNVCRHRGSRICLEAKGKRRTLTCPYHAWAWDLEGQLIAARNMPDGFDAADWPLHKCQVRVWQGLIFINLARGDDREVIDFADIERDLADHVRPHRLDEAKIVSTKFYPTDGNWKLAVENFTECYHCVPSHPGYTAVNAYVKAYAADRDEREKRVKAWRAEWAAKGHATGEMDVFGTDPRQPHGVYRQPIRDGSVSLSKDGQSVAPLMGELKDFDGGDTYLSFGPLSYLYLANDHATLFRFTPIHPTLTDVKVSWLVRGDAREGDDYDLERLEWMWNVTTIEDTKIISDNQLGVNSRRYAPGPYSEMEYETAAFVAWYLGRMAGDSAPAS